MGELCTPMHKRLKFWRCITGLLSVKAYKFPPILPIIRSLHWLKINERIEYKLFSFTYKVFTANLTTYTISPFSLHVATLARPGPICIFLITNHQPLFSICISLHPWNKLPSLIQPHTVHSPSACSTHLQINLAPITSSQFLS